ncbi:MAG: hypothetical protein M3063_07040 [Actinomycetota bacterium]|nr:hypothetical protein [Actinomycetota bacterium]
MKAQSTGADRAALVVRTGWGLLLLGAPGLAVRAAGGTDERASRRVVRVLGARHLAEAGLEARHGPGVRRAGGAVDLLHAVTAVGFGVADRRWRRPALADAVVASAFAATGLRRHGASS